MAKPPSFDDMDNVQEIDLQRVRRSIASGVKDQHGDAEGVVAHPDDLDKHNHSSTVILVKDIADILIKHYPGWAWAVQPDERGQVINIFNLHCHTSYGYTIRMDDIMYDMRRKEAYRAGANILKRFQMPDRMDTAQLDEAPRDGNGMLIPDISDFPAGKERDNAHIANMLATGQWDIVYTAEGPYLRKNP